MKDRTNQLIQAYNKEGEQIGLFRLTGTICPTDHIEEVIRDYFADTDEENAAFGLYKWGITRVHVEYTVNI